MSKGIVKGTPGITHANVMVVIADANDWDLGAGAVLDFGPDAAQTNNPAYEFFHMHEGDYIEFTITGNNSDHDGTCNFIKKIQSKGIVREVFADGKGKLMVTVANPNNYEVAKNADLTFNNISELTLNQNDYVEFDNITKDKLTGKMTCDATRKIESRGDITIIPVPEQGIVGEIKVSQAAADSGVPVGTSLSFPLPDPRPSPFNLRDIVEINIIDGGSSE